MQEHAPGFEAAVSPQSFIKTVVIREVPEGRGPQAWGVSSESEGARRRASRQAQSNEALPYPVGGGAAPSSPPPCPGGSQGPAQKDKK